MELIGRHRERQLLDKAHNKPRSLVAIWGKQKVGKSRLLVDYCQRNNGVYVVAVQSSGVLQRQFLATALAKRFPEFHDERFSDWRSLFESLGAVMDDLDWNGPIVIDDVQFLNTSGRDFLADLTTWWRSRKRSCQLIVSGSDASTKRRPNNEQFKSFQHFVTDWLVLEPLHAGYLLDVFNRSSFKELVELYAVFGGIPKYLAYAQPYANNLLKAVDELILDPHGLLHDEPIRLLRDQQPMASSLRPILDAMGQGATRVTEIANVLELPPTSLSRPLNTLLEMDWIRREIPYGAEDTSKKSSYRFADPFLRFWFTVVAPVQSSQAQLRRYDRIARWQDMRESLVQATWAEMCRAAVPQLHETNDLIATYGPFLEARKLEVNEYGTIDVVANSLDRATVMVGQSCLERQSDFRDVLANKCSATDFPVNRQRKTLPVTFFPLPAFQRDQGCISAKDILNALR